MNEKSKWYRIESNHKMLLCCACLLGEAALYILREEFGDNWPEKVKVIFAGDDTTDEDAMRVNIYVQTCVGREKINSQQKF